MASAINALMAYADSTDNWVRRDNDQIWLGLCNLIVLLRKFGACGYTRGKLPNGDLEPAISAPERVGRPREKGRPVRETGNAALGRIALLHWGPRKYSLGETQE